MNDCFSKSEYFHKAQNCSDWFQSVATVCDQYILSYLRKSGETPEVTDMGEDGFRLHKKNIARFFQVGFIAKFSQQAKVPQFKVVFHLANFFDVTNVSVQLILFHSTLSSGLLFFFGMDKRRSTRSMLILFILTLYGTFDISFQ